MKKQLATSQRTRGVVDWADAFLSALEQTGVITKACEAANVGRITVWRRKQSDAGFAERYNESINAGAQLLEAEAIRRASEGLLRKKFTKGGAPIIDPVTGEQYVEREYSDTLLALLLRRHIPEYRDRPAEVNTNVNVHNYLISAEKLKSIRERHAKALQSYAR